MLKQRRCCNLYIYLRRLINKVWNVCSKSWRKTAEWHVKKCTFCWNFASICLPHFDWTLAQTSNCHPVGSAWPQWGTKVSRFWKCTTIVAQISWRMERISAKGGCYWRNLDPGFRAWIEISFRWVERQNFPETEKIQEGPVERETNDIFAYDCKGVIMTDWVPSGTTVTEVYYRQFLRKLRRKMQANRPDLLEKGVLILHEKARPHLGKDIRKLLDRYSWEVLPHPPYSPDMSPPEFDLFPELKINIRGGGTFCFRYPTRQTAQLFYRPDGYHGTSKTLGCSRSAEGGLHWKTITLYRTSGVLFCRYCVLCISFEMAYVCFTGF